MCGVVGIVNLKHEPVSPVVLQHMADLLAHRGPDGQGTYRDRHFGVGHRRLAVIDTSNAGAQPMVSDDGRYVISYNGEVFNYQELRTELRSLGRKFVSESDTEVVLAAVAHWGTDAFHRFNGMFALAVWDRESRELLLARDRYGIKPLYYAFIDGALYFASEHKALRAVPGFSPCVDPEGLLEYFTFQNFFTDRTLLQGVKTFPAGSWARFRSEDGSVLRPVKYWDYSFQEPSAPLRDEEYLEELDFLFRQAVRRQLVADVEIGAYLSGGIDSGAVTALAAQEIPHIRSFTCGFDLHSASGLELGYDERTNAELLSYKFRTEHYEMVLKSGDMERIMPLLVRHLEEPRVGQSYPNYYIAQLAGKFVKVVLSGAGGDEMFGGYPWRYYRAVVNDSFEQYIDKYYVFWQRLIPNQAIQSVFAPVWDKMKHVWTRDIFRDVFDSHDEKPSRPEDYVNRSLHLEAKTFLHGLLVMEDKLSMAHGLETRVPFLDNDLVDFAMQLPVHLKLGKLGEVVRINENEVGKQNKFYAKNRDGKLLLRQCMERYLPKEITRAAKQGFSAPDASWFKGESIGYVRKKLFSPRARIYEYMDRATVLALIMEHLEGKVNRRLFVWSLLYFESWLAENMGEQ